MAEIQNKPATLMQSTADQIKGLTEIKPGQAVNIAYIEKVLGPDGMQNLIDTYGVQIENSLMTINEETNLPGLITDIANKAAEAGALIPEQLAELADAVADMLDSITAAMPNETKNINIINNEYYGYFFNGWPKECFNQKITGYGLGERIETSHIVWIMRHWNLEIPEDEDQPSHNIQC